MSDLISRDEAIDAMANALWHYPNDGYRNLNEYKFARGLAEFGLKSVPSAQPEPCEDAVSRRRLLSDLKELIAAWEKYPVMAEQIKGVETAIEYVELIPSVQLEPLTDKEKRIFLAAMGREEKVCKQVDDECRDCREPYEDSLVRTCHEITRKVKGALWET